MGNLETICILQQGYPPQAWQRVAHTLRPSSCPWTTQSLPNQVAVGKAAVVAHGLWVNHIQPVCGPRAAGWRLLFYRAEI